MPSGSRSAFYLGPQAVAGRPLFPPQVFWLKRLDKESLGRTGPELLNGVLAQDWLQDSRGVERISALLGAAKTRSLPVKRIEKKLYHCSGFKHVYDGATGRRARVAW